MDSSSLVIEQIDAGIRFVSEFAKSKPVQAAFWLRASGDERWYLYIASDQIDDSNFDTAYGEVLRLARAAPDPWLDPFQVKVIGTGEPLARAVMNLARRYPGPMPIRYGGPRLGGVDVEGVYIYPLPAATPTQ